jgi:hypothetical protein
VYNFRIDVIRHLIAKGFRILVIAPDDENSPLLKAEGCGYVPLNLITARKPSPGFYLYSQLKSVYKKHKPDFIFHYVIKPNIYGSLPPQN